MEPFEFIIPRRPLSQRANPRSRREWQLFVRAHAENNWKPTYTAGTEPVSVMLMSLYEEKLPDVDNIPKYIIDALKGLAFDDDSQVTDLISRRRYLRATFRELDRVSAVLVAGLDLGTEFVYVRGRRATPGRINMSHPLRNTVSTTLHSEALQTVAEQYRAKGYQVSVEPKAPDVPSFLEKFHPDLIARRPGESIVVEVKVDTQRSVAGRYQHMAEIIRNQPGWRFDLVVMRPGEGEAPGVEATLPTEVELATRLEEAEELQGAGSLSAAFMVLWAVVEGLMRLEAQRVGLPLERMIPTSALIRELYSAGEVNGEDYETLLRLMETRNGVVHGFSTPVWPHQLTELRAVVEHLFGEIRRVST